MRIDHPMSKENTTFLKLTCMRIGNPKPRHNIILSFKFVHIIADINTIFPTVFDYETKLLGWSLGVNIDGQMHGQTENWNPISRKLKHKHLVH